MKIESKQLESGFYQVKFQINHGTHRGRYGYLLVEPEACILDVMCRISNYLEGCGKYGNIRTFEYANSQSPIFINSNYHVAC